MEISMSSMYEAFERVKANHGCAGVDGVTIGMFEKNLKEKSTASE